MLVLNIRQAYYAHGYLPVPVYTGQKVPMGKAWQKEAWVVPPAITTESPNSRALSTGILCDGLRPIDIDIDDESLLYQVAEYALTNFGAAPLRFRCNSPRILLLYRAAVGTPQKSSTKNTKTGYGVEVLGLGNQFVADGKHHCKDDCISCAVGMHRSGAIIEWEQGPDQWKRDDLIALDDAQVEIFLRFVATLINADRSTFGRSSPMSSSIGTPTSETWLICDIKDALNNIPNPGTDWESWWRIGAAVYAASGGAKDGFTAWRDWSQKSSKHHPANTVRTWDKFKTSPVASITAGTLIHAALTHNPAWRKYSQTFTPLRCF